MEYQRQQRHGFTLVELLVVIGIISVLIAILLPALSKARDAANRVACLANLRQLSVLLLQYADENQYTLPATKASYHKQYWAEACFAMMKRIDATTASVGAYGNPVNRNTPFICPTDPKPWAGLVGGGPDYAGAQYQNVIVATSYACNGFLMPSWVKNKSAGVYEWSNARMSSTTDPGGPQKLTKAKTPSSTYLLMDWTSAWGSNGEIFPTHIYWWKTSYNDPLPLFTPHADGTHVGFADGHAEWVVGLLKNGTKPSSDLVGIAQASDW